jgi:Flp pilus assembly pilin Flp
MPPGGVDGTETVDEPAGFGDGRPRLHQITVGRANTTTLQYCLIAALMTIAALLIFAPIGTSVSIIFEKISAALSGN